MRYFMLSLCMLMVLVASQPVIAQQYKIVTRQRLVKSEIYASRDTQSLFSSFNIYRYSGNRGSVFTPLWQEHMGYGYVRFSSSIYEFPYANLPFPFEDFYTDDVKYDTLYDYYDMNQPERQVRYRVYNDSSQWTEQSEQNSPAQPEITKNCIYDASGRLKQFKYISYQQGGGMPAEIYTAEISYNNEGYVRADTATFYSSKHQLIRAYEYDLNNRLISMRTSNRDATGQWRSNGTLLFEYDERGRATKCINLQPDSTGKADTMSIERMEYDDQNHMTAMLKAFYHQNGISTQKYYYYFNNAGALDSATLWLDNSQQLRQVFFNNSFNNPDSMHAYRLGGYLNRLLHTYELYNDTVDVIDTPADTKRIVLFPNPASDKVTVRWNSEHPRRPVNMTLYNAAGQFVRRRYVDKPQNEESMDISGLAVGMYMIRILSATGGEIYTGNLAVTY